MSTSKAANHGRGGSFALEDQASPIVDLAIHINKAPTLKPHPSMRVKSQEAHKTSLYQQDGGIRENDETSPPRALCGHGNMRKWWSTNKPEKCLVLSQPCTLYESALADSVRQARSHVVLLAHTERVNAWVFDTSETFANTSVRGTSQVVSVLVGSEITHDNIAGWGQGSTERIGRWHRRRGAISAITTLGATSDFG